MLGNRILESAWAELGLNVFHVIREISEEQRQATNDDIVAFFEGKSLPRWIYFCYEAIFQMLTEEHIYLRVAILLIAVVETGEKCACLAVEGVTPHLQLLFNFQRSFLLFCSRLQICLLHLQKPVRLLLIKSLVLTSTANTHYFFILI